MFFRNILAAFAFISILTACGSDGTSNIRSQETILNSCSIVKDALKSGEPQCRVSHGSMECKAILADNTIVTARSTNCNPAFDLHQELCNKGIRSVRNDAISCKAVRVDPVMNNR